MEKARSLAAEADRAAIGDEKIGEMLSHSPKDDDGTWPCVAVRDIIESVRSRHLETGFYIGVKNARGVTSRSPFAGGELERDEAVKYRAFAKRVQLQWPRSAAILQQITDSYEDEAKEHDQDADRRQW